MNKDAVDQLIELMSNEAGKEHIKHQLQAVIAAEVRETVTGHAARVIREVVEDSVRTLRADLNENIGGQRSSALVEEYADAAVKKMGHFAKEPEQILEAVATKLQHSFEQEATYNRANELVEAGKEQLMERVYESIDRRVNELLREQLNFWKERADELTLTIHDYHKKIDQMAVRDRGF